MKSLLLCNRIYGCVYNILQLATAAIQITWSQLIDAYTSHLDRIYFRSDIYIKHQNESNIY